MYDIIFKKPCISEIRSCGLNCVDMHFHTEYSMDGISKLGNVLKKCSKLGMGVAVTDHNEIKGSVKACNSFRKVLVVPGVEVTTRNGSHVLLYFYTKKDLKEFWKKRLQGYLVNNPFFASVSASELVEVAQDYNCVIGAPHPYAPGITGVMKEGLSKKTEKKLDCIEVLNGYNLRGLNKKAVAWNSRLKKGITGGSDGHTTSELGHVVTCFEGSTVSDVLEAVRKKKTNVIGKEDGFLMKAILGVDKEVLYLGRSHHDHLALRLLESQIGTEFKYFKKQFAKGKFATWLRHHHW